MKPRIWWSRSKFVNITSQLSLMCWAGGVPCNPFVQGRCGTGTRAGRLRLNPLLTPGVGRLEATAVQGLGLRSPEAEKILPSVRVCEWWSPSCLRGSQNWGGAPQLLHFSVWNTCALKVKLPQIYTSDTSILILLHNDFGKYGNPSIRSLQIKRKRKWFSFLQTLT